jgi:hypothetical protein
VIDEDAYPEDGDHVFPGALAVVGPPAGEGASLPGRQGSWGYLSSTADTQSEEAGPQP